MAAPYPLVSDILVDARVIANDAIQTIGGNTLTDAADFTPYYVNRAWQKFQQDLLGFGYVRLRIPNLILTIPPVNSEDAQLEVFLNWYGYYDGVNVDSSIVLPQTLIKPLKLAERPSGDAPNVNAFIDMDGPEQGIVRVPGIPKQQWNGIWVWNNDAIWMPGATVETQLRIDYASYLPDFTGSGAGFPGTQTADIMRCRTALATYIAAEFCAARGDVDAAAMMAQGKQQAGIVAGVQPAETSTGAM